eukprot:CAMPEP_0174889230 /NCGR_PEP_ID=MMETSP0167-20121228/4491_1 /TAXON_ID=38298 /ORGANISM="Rhodella maculata, Strain CCMP736" /LENGTH=75 /DNA_ID=CAMNT_0016126555 /DNA_START=72 /DNA_END=299 /DNA_ORIENTATION=-
MSIFTPYSGAQLEFFACPRVLGCSQSSTCSLIDAATVTHSSFYFPCRMNPGVSGVICDPACSRYTTPFAVAPLRS